MVVKMMHFSGDAAAASRAASVALVSSSRDPSLTNCVSAACVAVAAPSCRLLRASAAAAQTPQRSSRTARGCLITMRRPLQPRRCREMHGRHRAGGSRVVRPHVGCANADQIAQHQQHRCCSKCNLAREVRHGMG